MKNLRKIFALVLVVAMAFSFAAVASAKYTDDSSIKYSTAVGVMSGIGAINGKPGGAFDPTGLVTRAEAAKMIAYAILGPALANSLPNVPASFKDTAGNWASKYIEYLTTLKIIGGRGDGTFDPNGNVTAIELAKMMLCAAGYGKNNEYTGAGWAFPVTQDAFNNNVFAGSAATDFTKAATREEAALYIFNAIMNIVKVQYSKTNDVYTPVAGNKTIAMATYNMVSPLSIVVENSATTAGLKGTKVVAANTTAGKISSIGAAATYAAYTTALADVGKVVTVYANSVTGVAYYMAPMSTSVTVDTAITTAAGYSAKFSTSAITSTHIFNAAANYASYTVNANTIGGFNGTTTAPTGTYILYAGDVVGYIAPTVSTIQKVTAIVTTAGSETITFTSTAALANNATSDVVNEYAGIAVGDYVQITNAGGITNAVKLTTVQGTVSEVGAGNTYVVIGGSKYMASTLSNVSGLTYAGVGPTDYGKTVYTLYLDSSNKAVGMTAPVATSTSHVVYIVAAEFPVIGTYGSTWGVQCVDSTGKEVIYNTGTTDPNVTAGFKTVTVDAYGVASFANVVPATDLAIATNENAISKTDVINGTTGGNTYYYAPDVQFIFITGTGATLKVEKVSGLAAADGNNITGAFCYFNSTASVNKTISTVVVPLAYANPTAVGTSVVYVPATCPPLGSNANGTLFDVYIDGVKTTVTSADALLSDVNTAHDSILGKFATYTISSTGVYNFTGINSTSVDDSTTVATNAIFSGYITVAGPITMSTAGAKVVDLVNTYPTPAVYTSVAALEAASNTTAFTVAYATNVSGTVTAIYVTGATVYSPAAVTVATVKGISGAVTVSQIGNTATYTLKLNGTAAGAATVTLTNGTYMATIPTLSGVTRTDATHLAIDDTTVLSNYTVTFTVTLTGVGAPVPTVVIS